jgi:hypothetical protein
VLSLLACCAEPWLYLLCICVCYSSSLIIKLSTMIWDVSNHDPFFTVIPG